jgi:glucokinase
VSSLRKGILVIDVGGTKISGAITNLENQILYEKTVSSRESIKGIADPELRITRALIVELSKYAEANGIELLRGCAGFPEYVNLAGLLTTAENVDWRKQPKEDFARLTDFPWVIQSDVRCAGIAEARLGAGRGLEDFVYLTISSGISHTHFLDGEAVTGPHGEAIGFGLIHIEVDGREYELEKYCSGLGISRRYAHGSNDFTLDAKALMIRFESNPEVREIITSATQILGEEMAKFVGLLGTQEVVIGGGLWLGSKMYRDLTTNAFKSACQVLDIKAKIRNAVIDHSGLVGASVYAVESLG